MKREPEVSGQAEDERRDAEAGDGEQERAAGVLHGRAVCEDDGHGDRADRRGGAEPAEAGCADVQDVLGEDGQQVDRAAEQDGEEVEAHRGEEDLLAPDERHAGEQGAEAGRFIGALFGDGVGEAAGEDRAGDEQECR